jgi:hypothetical protein
MEVRPLSCQGGTMQSYVGLRLPGADADGAVPWWPRCRHYEPSLDTTVRSEGSLEGASNSSYDTLFFPMQLRLDLFGRLLGCHDATPA